MPEGFVRLEFLQRGRILKAGTQKSRETNLAVMKVKVKSRFSRCPKQEFCHMPRAKVGIRISRRGDANVKNGNIDCGFYII